MGVRACRQEASRGFELRSLDSESRVLAVTPRGRLIRDRTADTLIMQFDLGAMRGEGQPTLGRRTKFGRLEAEGRRSSRRRQQHSATRTRARVARVRAEYPNQLDYSGFVPASKFEHLSVLIVREVRS